MNDNYNKLIKCFSLVFPEVDQIELSRVSVNNSPEWDSLTNIQLVSLLEEEFDLEINSVDLEDLYSFEMILDFLNKKNV